MKELTSVQMENVSGAGIFSGVFGTVGSALGALAETTGWKNAGVNAGNFAKSAGQVIDSAIDTMTSFFKLVLSK